MEATDTHCHLDFEIYDNDRDKVLERARKAKLVRILNPGIDLDTSSTALRLATEHPDVFAAVGIHPNSALGYSAESIDQLRSLAKHQKVVAIGEIGLDYYRDAAAIDLQKRVLLQQLDLAAELNLPVVLHNREATDDILVILEKWHNELKTKGSNLILRPGVLHSFSGSVQEAYRAIKLGFKIGINGPITFKNSSRLQDVVATIDLEDILIETDAPFLTPHPYRGKRNEPAYVLFVAQRVATIKNVSLEVVMDITTQNALYLFNW